MADIYTGLTKGLYKIQPMEKSGVFEISPEQIGSGALLSVVEQNVGTIQNGKVDFDNTATGFILGVDSDTAKFFIGSSTNYLNWDGSSLTVRGTLTASVIQTAASPNARITINESANNSLKVYDSSNNTVVIIGPGLSTLISAIQTSATLPAITANNNAGVTYTGSNLVNFTIGEGSSTGDILKLAQVGTGYPLVISNIGTKTSSHFIKQFSFYNGTTTNTFWQSNGTTPDGNLSGTEGDICANADGGQTYYCTGTTNWTSYSASADLSGFFGTGADGDATIASGTTTLTADKHYNDLTLSDGAVLDCGGYRIFVNGTLTKNGTGKISANGNAGSAGTNGSGATKGSGGAAGAARTTGSLWGGNGGVAGSNGGDGDSNGSGGAGSNATNGTAKTGTYQGNGRAGAQGSTGGNGTGANGGAPGTAGTAGTGTNVSNKFDNPWDAVRLLGWITDNIYQVKSVAGSGGSSGAGGGGSGAAFTATGGGGGGGGGGGSDAGNIVVCAYALVNNGTGNFFEAIGGDGGNGGNGGNATGGTPANGGAGGGGGGGDSGAGGIIRIIYHSLTGSISQSVAAGTPGTKGNPGSVGANPTTNPATASDGTAGVAGDYLAIQI